MGKPYARELAALDSSFEWSRGVGIEILRSFVSASSQSPLVVVGSGGSCTAAHFAALLHRKYSGRLARSTTPLDLLLSDEIPSHYFALMVSASGRNHDVGRAARKAIRAEVLGLCSITMSARNPLTDAVAAYSRGFAFAEQVSTGKDGYLATNSLLATLVVLARAYGLHIPDLVLEREFQDLPDMADRGSAIVLHAAWASPIATDLESRLHESTLLNVQVSDYRNFGHGRHLWLARRSPETLVVALLTPETKNLAERTLKNIPSNVPIVRLESSSDGPMATIELLVTGLHWTGALASLRLLDPGRPKVPAFGRRLFHLRPPKDQGLSFPSPVQRKLSRVGTFDDALVDAYTTALEGFKYSLARADIGAVVLDYDGTLCATMDRYDPLSDAAAAACVRILNMGLLLGIATGRGKSVRKALRAAIPENLWNSITVGYYNGSELASLLDESAPDKSRPEDNAISALRVVLEKDPILSALATIEVRPAQITIGSRADASSADLYTHTADLLNAHSIPAILMRSGHSIDLVSPSVSKTTVVRYLESQVSPRDVLCIGDRGAWPGNDCQLLNHPFSLSVDEVSSDPDSCWNLAPGGELGYQATLRYLLALEINGGAVHFSFDRFFGVSL